MRAVVHRPPAGEIRALASARQISAWRCRPAVRSAGAREKITGSSSQLFHFSGFPIHKKQGTTVFLRHPGKQDALLTASYW